MPAEKPTFKALNMANVITPYFNNRDNKYPGAFSLSALVAKKGISRPTNMTVEISAIMLKLFKNYAFMAILLMIGGRLACDYSQIRGL